MASHSPTKWPTKGAQAEAGVGKTEVDVSSSGPRNEMTSGNPGSQVSEATLETSKDFEGTSDDGVEDSEPRKSKSKDLDLMPDIQKLEKRSHLRMICFVDMIPISLESRLWQHRTTDRTS